MPTTFLALLQEALPFIIAFLVFTGISLLLRTIVGGKTGSYDYHGRDFDDD